MLVDKDTYAERPVAVGFTSNMVVVTLANGTVLQNPLEWHPWLAQATEEQRANYELGTFSVDWPDLDEGLDIEGMKQSIPSDPAFERDRESVAVDSEALALAERIARLEPDKRHLVDEFLDLLTRA